MWSIILIVVAEFPLMFSVGTVTLDSHKTLCIPLIELTALSFWLVSAVRLGTPERHKIVTVSTNIYCLLTVCPFTVLGCIICIISFNPHNSSMIRELLGLLTRKLR